MKVACLCIRFSVPNLMDYSLNLCDNPYLSYPGSGSNITLSSFEIKRNCRPTLSNYVERLIFVIMGAVNKGYQGIWVLVTRL